MTRVDEILASLVQQFASPYDFLRELVQNAMDAGSSLVEVELQTHRRSTDSNVVFELALTDDGEGMNEAILDEELTRLYGTSKRGDQTQAGGYGIGFVSVFAWQPRHVLVQTGRAGEAWELLFHPDRRFEKVRLDGPFEGTQIRAFKLGHDSQREAVAQGVREALWRWCRYCPVELVFEDLESSSGPERFEARAISEDAIVSSRRERGTSRIEVAFGVPPHAVLCRHGLVLEEGQPDALLETVSEELVHSSEHLRVLVDSTKLRTTMARDSAVRDEGRREVEAWVLEEVRALRSTLVDRAVEMATGAPWTAQRQRMLSHAWAHLACEVDSLGERLERAHVLRTPAGRTVAPRDLASRARHPIVAMVEPTEPDLERVRSVRRCGLGQIIGSLEDLADLTSLLRPVGLRLYPLRSIASKIAPSDGPLPRWLDPVQTVLSRLNLGRQVRLGALVDAEIPPLLGWQLEVDENVAIHSVTWPRPLELATAWLDERHPLVRAAVGVEPEFSGAAIVGLILAMFQDVEGLDRDRVIEVLEGVLDGVGDG